MLLLVVGFVISRLPPLVPVLSTFPDSVEDAAKYCSRDALVVLHQLLDASLTERLIVRNTMPYIFGYRTANMSLCSLEV